MARVTSRKTRRRRLLDYVLMSYLLLMPAICLAAAISCLVSVERLEAKINKMQQETSAPEETYWVPEIDDYETAPVPETVPAEVETCSVEPVISCTEEEEALLVSLVIAEAKGEPYEGQVAVAQVVCDRVAAGYGDTITEVIYAENQFATPSTESHDKYPLAVKAVHAVLYEGARAFEEPTIFFFNPATSSPSAVEWLRTKPYIGTIGNHEFRGA